MTHEPGTLENAVRETIAELGDKVGISKPLSELAIILAERLDRREGGTTGMAISSNSKELRETLKQMTEESESGDKLQELLDRFEGPVLTSVRDPKTA